MERFEVNLDTQTVDVTTNDSLKYQDVLAQITKTGKKVTKGNEEIEGAWKEQEI